MQQKITAIPAEIKTKLDNMNLIDRFLFNETMENIEAYNAMVEIYYQGQVDVSLLKPGCIDFNQLNDLTIILIAPFDIFGYGLYKYTFEETCKEIPHLKLEDGAKRIFINTYGNNPENFSQEFLDFMNYINESTDEVAARTRSPKIRLIHDFVSRIRVSEKIGVKYMQWWEEKAYARKEGQKALLIEKICQKRKKGLPPEIISEHLEEDISLVRAICSIADNFSPEYDTNQIFEEWKNKIVN